MSDIIKTPNEENKRSSFSQVYERMMKLTQDLETAQNQMQSINVTILGDAVRVDDSEANPKLDEEASWIHQFEYQLIHLHNARSNINANIDKLLKELEK